MTPAEILLRTLALSSEGTRKEGFTLGAVSYSFNQQAKTVTGSFTIPVDISNDPDSGDIIIAAKDFLELPT